MNRPYPPYSPEPRPIPCPEPVRFRMLGEDIVFIGIFQGRLLSRPESQRSSFPENIPASSSVLSPPGDHRKKMVCGFWL